MKLRVLLVLLVVMVAVAACAAPPELRNPSFLKDSSLVDNEPCEAPCWRGITPGETSWRDALTTLEDDATLSDVKTETNEETGEIAATFQRADGVPCCLVYTSDGDVVDQMLLQLAPDNTLGEVIENLGEPEYFSGTEVSPEQAAAALFYPEKQLVVYAFVAGVAEGEITEDSEVFAALYLTEDDMAEVLQTSNLHDWLGYDTYAAYAARPFNVTPMPTTEGGETTDDATAEPADDTATDEAEEATTEPTGEPTPDATATEG
jgi:hypothetical protein